MSSNPNTIGWSMLLSCALVAACVADPQANSSESDLKSQSTPQSATVCDAKLWTACINKNGKNALACADHCPASCFPALSDCLASAGGNWCAKRCTMATVIPAEEVVKCDRIRLDNCYEEAKTSDQKAACAKYCPEECRSGVASCMKGGGGGIACAQRAYYL
jgi:hypothetical protein